MSRAPAKPPPPRKASVGSRSHLRRRRREQNRTTSGPNRRTQALSLPALGLRGALRRVPTAAWVCALIALLNACAWSIITPLFQGKDEIDHFAYVARLAEAHALPEKENGEEPYSTEERQLMSALHYYEVRFTPFRPSLSSTAEQHALAEEAAAGGSLKTTGEAGRVTTEAPLYYAIEVIPYYLGGANPLTKLELMRLFGGLFAALTALFSFFFLRELLPRVPWAATAGAACVALQPLLGFMSGSLNPDVMLFTVSAAVLLCLARAFRRGLSPRLAIALGVLIIVGFLTKLNFIGFAFGVFVGMAVLAVREARRHGRRGLQAPAITAGIGLAPVALYMLHNIVSGQSPIKAVIEDTGHLTPTMVLRELSYTWQMFMPRLPGMTQYFKGMFPLREVWFDRSVGLYGWMDTMFPSWVDNVALVLAAVVAVLCGRELYKRRDALKARLPELFVYATIVLGLLLMIGFSSYKADLIEHELSFGEPRYLLPALPLLGAVIVLAIRGAGRKWAPAVGAAMVLLFLGHDIFSQLQVIARYYG
jgi:Predicted membrane protein (DUF2142)